MMLLSLRHTTITSQFTKITIFLSNLDSKLLVNPWLLISMLKILKGMQLVRIFLIALKTCHTSSGSGPGGLGHDHMYHEALLEIIILKAVVLPIDSDMLYKDDCL